jgi:hypothetical protein
MNNSSRIRKRLFLLLPLLILVPLIPLVVSYTIFRMGTGGELKLPETPALRDGDLVFRRGISVESYAVVQAGKTNIYSHVGLIVIEQGIPFVIHVEPGEAGSRDQPVRKETLRSFLDPGRASRFAIYRSCLGKERLDRVTSMAKRFYREGCRFDNAYDLQDDRFLYCTELVFKAYREGDRRMNTLLTRLERVRLLVYSHRLLMPGAFINSNLFYKICDQ